MGTPLGYTSAGLASVSVMNCYRGDRNNIRVGDVVSLYISDPDSAVFVSPQQQVVPVGLAGGVDALENHCGIALSNMPTYGSVGTICMMGPCLAKAAQDGSMEYPAYSEALAVEASDTDAGSSLVDRDAETIVGVALGDAALATTLGYGPIDYDAATQYYVRAWVNFIASASFGYT